MKTRIKLLIALMATLLALPMGGQAVVFVDTMDGPTLNPMWKLEYNSTYSFGAGGGFVIGGGDGIARFNNVGNYAYAHLETVNQIDTTGGLRVDAIMRQDNYPTSTFGMSVGIYFNADNWVSIKQGAASQQSGWGRYVMDNGIFTAEWGGEYVELRGYWLISAVELTDTQILFYGSPISPRIDQYGETDIEANVSVISDLTMDKPAGFTGNALVIIGKGYTGPGLTNPDFDNLYGSDNFAFSGIDYVRLTGPNVPVIVPVTLQGTVAPENYTGDRSELGARIELWQGGVLKQMKITLLGTGGQFSIPNVYTGTYDMVVKVGGWLPKTVSATLTPTSTNIGTVTLTNGDGNGDGAVSSADLTTVLANLDAAGDL